MTETPNHPDGAAQEKLFELESVVVQNAFPDTSTTIWRASLSHHYANAIDELDKALRGCPDELWEQNVWEVKRTDWFVWPILRGAGADLPDDERLQMFAAFWNVAYHALFHLDFYLSGGELPFDPPAPFREDDHHGQVLPHRVYTRDELQTYLIHGRNKAHKTLGTLTDEQSERPCHHDRDRPFSELLLDNLVHVREHAAQLNLFLGWKTG